METNCPNCGSNDLVIGKTPRGYGDLMITSMRGTGLEHIVCADCGMIVYSRITNVELAKKKGNRIVFDKRDLMNDVDE